MTKRPPAPGSAIRVLTPDRSDLESLPDATDVSDDTEEIDEALEAALVRRARARDRAGRVPSDPSARERRAWKAAASATDPEVPVLTIEDLGVLRDVHETTDGGIVVTITPTYSGCPAMDLISVAVELALRDAGFERARIELALAPAWTTDWMTAGGRAKLKAYGIAPPGPATGRRALFGEEELACPRCESSDTAKISEFGSTACKALWRCNACGEPFDYFKCH